MLQDDIICPNPDCDEKIKYWQHTCRSMHFVGFPNYRSAELQRDALNNRYEKACDDADRRGVLSLLTKLEEIADECLPVISMGFEACDDILRARKYWNYREMIESGARDPASERDHANRGKVRTPDQ